MPEHKQHEHPPRDDQSQGGAASHTKPTGEGISDKPAGTHGGGYVEGVGGTGGASGAGAVRVKTDESSDISGMGAGAGGSDTSDVQETTSGESGSASGYRRSTSGNSGMPGMTRGAFRETIPDAEDDRDNPPPRNTKKYKERGGD